MSSGTSERPPAEASVASRAREASPPAHDPAPSPPSPGSISPDSPSPELPARGKLPLKERLSALFSEYGRIAIYTYFTLSILAIIGFSIAVGLGYKPTTSTGVIGVIITGWALANATLPIRIPIT